MASCRSIFWPFPSCASRRAISRIRAAWVRLPAETMRDVEVCDDRACAPRRRATVRSRRACTVLPQCVFALVSRRRSCKGGRRRRNAFDCNPRRWSPVVGGHPLILTICGRHGNFSHAVRLQLSPAQDGGVTGLSATTIRRSLTAAPGRGVSSVLVTSAANLANGRCASRRPRPLRTAARVIEVNGAVDHGRRAQGQRGAGARSRRRLRRPPSGKPSIAVWGRRFRRHRGDADAELPIDSTWTSPPARCFDLARRIPARSSSTALRGTTG